MAKRNLLSTKFGSKVRNFLTIICIISVLQFAISAYHSFSWEDETSIVPLSAGARRLTSSGCECPAIDDWEKNGGFMIYVLLVFFLFLGLAIICDEYFVASLEMISEALNLSEDVAGATFMAAGSSAPELFSSMTALFNPSASDSIGIATIVGSAIFNVLVIIAVTGIFAGQVLDLDWKPLVRDGFFYLMCVIMMIVMFQDGKVELYEGLILCLLYGVYVGFMTINQKVFDFLDDCTGRPKKVKKDPELELQAMERADLDAADKFSRAVRVNIHVHAFINKLRKVLNPPSPTGYAKFAPVDLSNSSAFELDNLQQKNQAFGDAGTRSSLAMEPESNYERMEANAGGTENPIFSRPAVADKGAGDDADETSPFEYPADETALNKIVWLVAQPYYYGFYYTVPDCRTELRKTWFMSTFGMSLFWISILTWFMVDWTNRVGCALSVPPVAMGTTVLAAGTSLPDALGSIAVAKQGQGDMAVSNAIGSNVFDILVGLGFPWLLTTIMRGEAIEIAKDDLDMNVLFLCLVLIIYFTLLFGNRLKLTFMIGIILLSCYGGFVIYTVTNTLISGGGC